MANTSTLGGRFALFLLMLFLAGTAAAQNCGGKERWGPKDGTDPQAPNIDLTNITPEAVTDLVAIHQPPLPGDNKTRIVPDEMNLYRVQARLAKWKHESDNDYHLVLTDDTLNYTDETANPPVPPTGHSFIGEVPDPSCFSGSDGSFGSQTPFADGITSARANTQGTQGWELAGVAVDTSRSDKYVGFLKRKKQ